MDVAYTTLFFSKKNFPFSELDALFRNISAELADGYVLARDNNAIRYLFIIGGKPYSGAIIDTHGKRTAKIKEFFAWYKGKQNAEISVFKADKKLLFCMLVKINHNPTQKFTTDIVNMEDVVKKLKIQDKDAVIALHSGKEWSFAIFMKGDVVYAYLPMEKAEEPPMDRLLSYAYGLAPDKPLSIEVYTDTKVMPSDDAVAFPDEGIATYYTKLPYEAYVELMEEGVVKGAYPVIGELTIGRDSTNAVCLPEAGISRQHAAIKGTNGKYVIEDLKSANGTFFKGIRITTKELFDGDEINIRRYILRFRGPKKKEKTEIKAPPEKDLATETIYAEEVVEEVETKPQIKSASIVLDDGTVFPLASITSIGKDEDADIKIEGVLVAKKHAVIVRGKGVFKLLKKGALSSVKVNGEKVDESLLKDGDVIEIGSRKMTFVFPKAEA